MNKPDNSDGLRGQLKCKPHAHHVATMAALFVDATTLAPLIASASTLARRGSWHLPLPSLQDLSWPAVQPSCVFYRAPRFGELHRDLGDVVGDGHVRLLEDDDAYRPDG
jgi:hypothetical protein